MISGDNPRTVGAVARAGRARRRASRFDARELPEDQDELAEVLEQHSVFGRVTPQQKRAMVGALQSQGHVVAMTGDGVNDALALKDADIGVAMGSGAAATRAVAQLVLLDGKFSTLPGVVAEGRRVIANIERVGEPVRDQDRLRDAARDRGRRSPAGRIPFLPRHLTIVSVFTIGIPGFFLALAPNTRRYVPGFVARVLRFCIPAGLVAGAAALVAYGIARYGHDLPTREARTTSALVLIAVGALGARDPGPAVQLVEDRCWSRRWSARWRSSWSCPRSATSTRCSSRRPRCSGEAAIVAGGRHRAARGGVAVQSRDRRTGATRTRSSTTTPRTKRPLATSQFFFLKYRHSTNVVMPMRPSADRVAVLPPQLGHVAEVHAVDAGDERGDDEDRAPRRHLLHHLVQLVRRDREVRLEQTGEQVALRLDEVADAQHPVVHVVEVHDGLVVDELDLAPDDRVDDFAQRRGGAPHRR